MPQTWDEKGNPIQAKPMPQAMPPPAAPTAKQKQTWDEHGTPIQASPAKPAQISTGIQSQPPPIQPQGPTPTSTSNPNTPYLGGYAGFTPGHMASSAGQGIKNVVQGTTGSWEKGHEGEGGLIEIGANIEKHLPEMGEQANEIRRQAKEAFKRGGVEGQVEGYTKGAFSIIPMLGPWLNDKYNQAMSGDVGGSAVETATTAGLAKVIEAVNDKGPNAAKDIKNAFPKHVIVGVSNLALDHVKNGQVGDAVIEGSRDTSKLGQAVKATKDRIGAKFSSINAADKIKDPNGFVPAKIATNTIDKAIADKGAQVLYDKKMMPSVAKIRALVEGYKGNLTFDNIKQMRSFIGDYYAKASGVEKAVLGDLYSSYSDVLKNRAKQLGPDHIRDYIEANGDTESLKNHQEGLIKDLKSKNTGLQYFNEITKESNKGRLNKLEADLHLPTGFFADTVRDFGPLHRLAALTEGSSTTGLKGSRISAFMRHPIAATAGITGGGAIGGGVGMLMGGHSMVGSIMGMTAAAMKVDDFLNRYDAARRIREMGGPDNVTGRGQTTHPPNSGAPPSGGSNLAPPQSGPGGGGSSPGGVAQSVADMKARMTPEARAAYESGEAQALAKAKASISPALAKLLPEAAKQAERRGAPRPTGLNSPPPDNIRIARLESLRKIVRDSTTPERDRKIAQAQLEDMEKNPSERNTLGDNPSQLKKDKPLMSKEEAEAASAKRTEGRTQRFEGSEPKVTKAGPEERGRTESVRKGMTKDTPEARRAKAAERIAAKRSEASRTQIKGTLEDQARQVAGKMDFQGKSNIELEEGLQELYGENGKRFLKQFQSLAKQQKWSDDVYRGYLEDTLDRRAKELASKPAIPGLNSEVKN